MIYTRPHPKPTPRAKKPRQALRRTWMRRRATSRRQDKLTTEDKRHLAWKATRPCVWHDVPGHTCEGPVQVAHLRDMTGTGRKEGARDTIPMCMGLHADHDQAKGPFLGMSKTRRKTWFVGWIMVLNASYDFEHGREPEGR